ncbi:hypothetical protein ACFQ4N_08900 [Oceanobacillus iheyensis]|uniref:hypothetical protein n=1 Tax=Oceanobacillus iheyensis TaxID=182710 RepID=UPI00363851A9
MRGIPQKLPFEVKNTFAKIDENDNLSIHYVGRENKDVFQYAVKTKNLTNVENNNTLSNGEDIYINIIESSKLSPVLELIYKKQEFEYVMNMKMNDKYTKDDLIKTAESLKLQELN